MDSESYTMRLLTVSAAEAEPKVPKQAEKFYFIKLHPYENPNLLKMESLIQKLGQDCIDANQKRQEKLAYRNKLQWSLGRTYYSHYDNRDWMRINLELLQISLDKLTFANNCSRGRAVKPRSTMKEIDRHSLHFGLLHVSKSVAEERQILSKIREVEKASRHSRISMEDYEESIRSLQCEIYRRFDMNDYEKEQIHVEIEKIEQEREEGIVSAASDEKMWNSLGSKETIKQQIKSMVDELEKKRPEHLKFKADLMFNKDELEAVEDDLASLEKQLDEIGRLKKEAIKCVSRWRAEQEEKNSSYGRYIELMRNARELAERKELVSLQKLSQEQVEKFMFEWNNDKGFRDEYRTRSIGSLNRRCLTIDGRRRDRDEKPIFVNEPAVNVSKSLKKALQKVT